MDELLKYGWINRKDNRNENKILFLKISSTMRGLLEKYSLNEYVIINYYLINNNGLYFIAENKIFNVDISNFESKKYINEEDINLISEDLNDIKKLKIFSVEILRNIKLNELFSII